MAPRKNMVKTPVKSVNNRPQRIFRNLNLPAVIQIPPEIPSTTSPITEKKGLNRVVTPKKLSKNFKIFVENEVLEKPVTKRSVTKKPAEKEQTIVRRKNTCKKLANDTEDRVTEEDIPVPAAPMTPAADYIDNIGEKKQRIKKGKKSGLAKNRKPNVKAVSKPRKRKGKVSNIIEPSKNIKVNEEILLAPNKYDFENVWNVNEARSQRRTKSDASECMNMSNSSTTTCYTVYSDQMVCIGNKLPVIKLDNLKYTRNDNEETLTDCESVNEVNNKLSKNDVSPGIFSKCESLSLSSQSSTKSDYNDGIIADETNVLKENVCDINNRFNILMLRTKNFESKIANFIGDENDDLKKNLIEVKTIYMELINILKEEEIVATECEKVKYIVQNNDIDTIESSNSTQNVNDVHKETIKQTNFIKPCSLFKSKREKGNNSEHISRIQQGKSDKRSNKIGENSDTSYSRERIDEKYNDDEDALSLFAESITGLEMSRGNSVIATPMDNDEYVPQPINVARTTAQIVNYMPTKIVKGNKGEISTCLQKGKIICEKQNADSTSIRTEHKNANTINGNYKIPIVTDHTDNIAYKDKEQNADSTSIHKENDSVNANVAFNVNTNYKDLFITNYVDNNMQNVKKDWNNVKPIEIKAQHSMKTFYRKQYGIKSVVFRGVCFFHLIASCKRLSCSFVHTHLDSDILMLRLQKLSEPSFIQEYMNIQNWHALRRRYGMYFVKECIRRELPMFLIDMSKDFIVKAVTKEDNSLKVKVIEEALLYLNSINLSTCVNFLTCRIGNELLCDVYMKVLAETQNFSRFKKVFIEIVSLMYFISSRFDIAVATLFLERICILPYEEHLVKALFKIISNTDQEIFSNSMIGTLEKQLSTYNNDLYFELQNLKEKASLNNLSLNKDIYCEMQNLKDRETSSNISLDKDIHCEMQNLKDRITPNNLSLNNDTHRQLHNLNVKEVSNNLSLNAIITKNINCELEKPKEKAGFSNDSMAVSNIVTTPANNNLESVRLERVTTLDTEKRYSPDTTDLDNVNKTTSEPMSQAIDFTQIRRFVQNDYHNNASTSTMFSNNNNNRSQNRRRWSNTVFGRRIVCRSVQDPVVKQQRPVKRLFGNQNALYRGNGAKYPRRI